MPNITGLVRRNIEMHAAPGNDANRLLQKFDAAAGTDKILTPAEARSNLSPDDLAVYRRIFTAFHGADAWTEFLAEPPRDVDVIRSTFDISLFGDRTWFMAEFEVHRDSIFCTKRDGMSMWHYIHQGTPNDQGKMWEKRGDYDVFVGDWRLEQRREVATFKADRYPDEPRLLSTDREGTFRRRTEILVNGDKVKQLGADISLPEADAQGNIYYVQRGGGQDVVKRFHPDNPDDVIAAFQVEVDQETEIYTEMVTDSDGDSHMVTKTRIVEYGINDLNIGPDGTAFVLKRNRILVMMPGDTAPRPLQESPYSTRMDNAWRDLLDEGRIMDLELDKDGNYYALTDTGQVFKNGTLIRENPSRMNRFVEGASDMEVANGHIYLRKGGAIVRFPDPTL